MRFIPGSSRRLMAFLILLCVGLLFSYPLVTRTLAQDDEPTDRPFPTSAASATPTASAQPTNPQPSVTTASGAATSAATVAVAAEKTPALTVDNIQSTSVAAQTEAERLRTENKDLQDKLTTAQNDKGATLFALVIVVIGVLLASAVFFGLRRS